MFCLFRSKLLTLKLQTVKANWIAIIPLVSFLILQNLFFFLTFADYFKLHS